MPARIDLTGQRYGRLVALRRTRSGLWTCQCDCGTIKDIPLDSLRSGRGRSCGCLRREATGQRLRHNLTGQRFGRLVVTGLAGTDRHNKTKWHCLCDCGTACVQQAGDLVKGTAKTCGCSKRRPRIQDETGNIYGRLTVLRWWGTSSRHCAKWLCQCSCGSQTVVTGSYLRCKDTKSCGCLLSEHAAVLGRLVGQFNRTEDSPANFCADQAYARRPAFLYLVEVDGMLHKIGIAFDIQVRGKGSYSAVLYQREMPRAYCWAVEQAALWITRDKKVNGLPDGLTLRDGWSELRRELDLPKVVAMMDGMADECQRIGWERFWLLNQSRQRLGQATIVL